MKLAVHYDEKYTSTKSAFKYKNKYKHKDRFKIRR